MYSLDALDGQIVLLFATEPRIGVLEASRRLGVARGTVQARLDRLERAGVITGWAPSVDPAALGFPVSAFATLEITQGARPRAAATSRSRRTCARSPRCSEAHTITGGADMMVRLVARSNADLQRVIDLVVSPRPTVARSSTVIVLATEIPPRVLPLLSIDDQE